MFGKSVLLAGSGVTVKFTAGTASTTSTSGTSAGSGTLGTVGSLGAVVVAASVTVTEGCDRIRVRRHLEMHWSEQKGQLTTLVSGEAASTTTTSSTSSSGGGGDGGGIDLLVDLLGGGHLLDDFSGSLGGLVIIRGIVA